MTLLIERPVRPAPAEDAITPTALRAPRRRLWRLTVLAYAALTVLALVSLKSDVVSGLAGSLLLQAYGLLVALYLASRMVFALGYRPFRTQVRDELLPSVAVVVPAFNEQERIGATIDSLFALDYPADKLRVIVLDDGSSDGTWTAMLAAAQRHPLLHAVRFSRNRGKRAGMAAGIRAAGDAEIVLFVDSDSTVEPQALREMVRPFLGPKGRRIGVVTGHVDVLNASANLLTRLQQVRYYAAFRVIKAAESIFGAVSCASGCFCAYRRVALDAVLPAWEAQTFLGREATFGDDRALTNYLLADGWRSVFQSTAVCGTAVPERWRGFLRQQLRWKKSWARESLRVLRIAWRWHPVAAAAMYASILLQLAGPFVAVHAMVWVPLRSGGDPVTYLLGLYAMAVLYGLFFAWSRRSPQWWGGIVFALAYTSLLCWQTYWAMARLGDNGWGTRASRYEQDGELRVSEYAGAPVDCGLPLADDAVHHLSPASPTAPSAPALVATPPSRRDWVLGTLAIPLTAVPLVAGLLLR